MQLEHDRIAHGAAAPKMRKVRKSKLMRGGANQDHLLAWRKALAMAKADGHSTNTHDPKAVAYVKKHYYHPMVGMVGSGSKTSVRKPLKKNQHKALKKVNKKCVDYDPVNPMYWKEKDGKCIKYSTHKRKAKGKGEGVLVGGCLCRHCGMMN